VGDINNPLSSTDKHSEKILTDPRTKQYHGWNEFNRYL
jgi:hypothetical protein